MARKKDEQAAEDAEQEYLEAAVHRKVRDDYADLCETHANTLLRVNAMSRMLRDVLEVLEAYREHQAKAARRNGMAVKYNGSPDGEIVWDIQSGYRQRE